MREIPVGLCQCGCGQRTPIATKTQTKRGWVKGNPIRFIDGHYHKRRPMIPDAEPFKIDGHYCRFIPLSRGLIAIVEIEDFERIAAHKWFATWRQGDGWRAIRNGNDGSRRIHPRMHQEILTVPPGVETVDHANGNTLDNRRSNLRPASRSENIANSKRSALNKSGFKGVYLHKRSGKWVAQIGGGVRRQHIGYFDTAQEAARAYNEQAKRVYGEYARLNEVSC